MKLQTDGEEAMNYGFQKLPLTDLSSKYICTSPDGTCLLAVDEEYRYRRHIMNFKVKVGDLKPNCRFIVGIGELVQIWLSRRAVLPFQLVRAFRFGYHGETLRSNVDMAKHLESFKSEMSDTYGTEECWKEMFGFYLEWSYIDNRAFMIDEGATWLTNSQWQSKSQKVVCFQVSIAKSSTILCYSAKVASCNYHQGLDMVVVVFSDGVFGLYRMPDFLCIHLLSIWSEKLSTAFFNERGNSVQLLVSQSYMLKQRGHCFDVNCLTYSPHLQFLAPGAHVNKVKVWNVMVAKSSSGNCTTNLAAGTSKYIYMSDILDQVVSFLKYFLKSCCSKYMLLLLPRGTSAQEQHHQDYNSVSILCTVVAFGCFILLVRFLWRYLHNVTPTKKKKKKKGNSSIMGLNEEDTQSEQRLGRQMIGKVILSEITMGEYRDCKIVFGVFQDRPVLVKYGAADAMKNEMKILTKSDFHQNIVRCFCYEKLGDQLLICLEQWKFTLDELVQLPDTLPSPNPKDRVVGARDLWTQTSGLKRPLISLIRDVALGLQHLHGLDIVHRSLTPKSIVIMSNGKIVTAKIADMRIAWLQNKQEKPLSYAADEKFPGYQPPDANYGKETNKVDMFAFGILMFYFITKGKHPFSCGGSASIEENIKNNQNDFDAIKDFPEAADLIPLLVDLNPAERPSAGDVLRHPFFWDSQQKMKFITVASDKAHCNNQLQIDIENRFCSVVGVGVQSWETRLDIGFFNMITSTAFAKYKYKYSRLRDLLRLMRNTQSHKSEYPPHVKALFLGEDGVFDYFNNLFPRLFFEVYTAVKSKCNGAIDFRRCLLEGLPFNEAEAKLV